MKTLGVLAQKGGVGKTTLALHWAVMAHQLGESVAIIDTDTQGSAASWGRRRKSEEPVVLEASESNLGEALDACQGAGITLSLIDTMPRIERPSVQAARKANLVVIPCGPTVLDIEAIGGTIAIAERVGVPALIVLNQCRHSSRVNDKAAHILQEYGLPICPSYIMRRAVLEDSFVDGSAVNEVEPMGKAAAEIEASWTWISEYLHRS